MSTFTTEHILDALNELDSYIKSTREMIVVVSTDDEYSDERDEKIDELSAELVDYKKQYNEKLIELSNRKADHEYNHAAAL